MIQTLFSNPLIFVTYLLALLVAITIHEFAHALTADKLGDPTPRLQGRVSLNPIKHLDPIGTIMILFIGFGWGKPVMFDPFNLRDPRRDSAIISLAGPASNFITAIVLAILLQLFTLLNTPFLTSIGLLFFTPIIQLSVFLGVFNLLPIHPLDGFKIMGGILPQEKAEEWYSLQKYGLFILIFLIFPFNGNVSILDLIIIRPVREFILPLLLPGI